MAEHDREIFEERIQDHYEDPYHRGPFDDATHRAEERLVICGDVVQIELRIDPSGVIEQAWFDGDGCVASQASASMLVEAIEGFTVKHAKEFSPNEMLGLVGVRLPPDRQKCCLLGWRVLQRALQTPVKDDIDDDASGRHFGGPSLSEES